jgi:putative transposase
MAAVAELANDVGTSAACQALCMPRASYYRDVRKTSSPTVSASRPSPARALRPAERDAVLARLHEERFQDRSPAAVYATLLDEGEYHCSIRTMYRLLDEHGEVRERRDQLTHPAYQKPELMATASNQLWSWDITKLLGPAKWTYFYLYVLLDVFSRHADSPIMPTINGNRVIGGARVVFGVGIIREFPRRPKAGRRGGIAPV